MRIFRTEQRPRPPRREPATPVPPRQAEPAAGHSHHRYYRYYRYNIKTARAAIVVSHDLLQRTASSAKAAAAAEMPSRAQWVERNRSRCLELCRRFAASRRRSYSTLVRAQDVCTHSRELLATCGNPLQPH